MSLDPHEPHISKIKKALVGYKKVLSGRTGQPLLVKLLIPVGAKVRFQAKNRYLWESCDGKLRTNLAKVLSVRRTRLDDDGYHLRTDRRVKIGTKTVPCSKHDTSGHELQYTEGRMVRPNVFDNDRNAACAGGIHFFLTKKEALNY